MEISMGIFGSASKGQAAQVIVLPVQPFHPIYYMTPVEGALLEDYFNNINQISLLMRGAE